MAAARTCAQCYFRVHELCALPRTEPCATFRAASPEGLTPPAQAPLVPRAGVGLAPAADAVAARSA